MENHKHDWLAYDEDDNDPATVAAFAAGFNVECLKCGARGFLNAARVITLYQAGRMDDVQ